MHEDERLARLLALQEEMKEQDRKKAEHLDEMLARALAVGVQHEDTGFNDGTLMVATTSSSSQTSGLCSFSSLAVLLL